VVLFFSLPLKREKVITLFTGLCSLKKGKQSKNGSPARPTLCAPLLSKGVRSKGKKAQLSSFPFGVVKQREVKKQPLSLLSLQSKGGARRRMNGKRKI